MIGFQRWVPWCLAALGLVLLFWITSAIYGAGKDAGKAEVTAVLVAEREAAETVLAQVKATAARESEASLVRLTATLQSEKETHDSITRELRAALDRSDLRGRALSADVARLHDAAAQGTSGGPAARAPEAPGSATGTPEDPADAPSVADLIETANENYGICLRNGARLVELQTWYESLRSQNPPE